jgi:hypothetical protein
MKFSEVFVPGGFPRYTYNPREQLGLEERLAQSKENLCKLVTVTGQTKSGKTVLARRIFPPEEAVWVDGGTVSEEDDFWQVIVSQLGLFQATQDTTSYEASKGLEASIGGEASAIVAKGSAELSGQASIVRREAQSGSRSVSSHVAALDGLRRQGVPLIVDDFHYIPREVQGSIVRALKPLIFDGLPVVIIAIPHRRYDALKVEKEMTGRIGPIDIPTWSLDELRFIPRTGFQQLNCELPPSLATTLAEEAIGSPHLMQEFCRGLCRTLGIHETGPAMRLEPSERQVQDVFRDVAETIGRPIFEKLARGPRQRADRIPRQLKNGKTVDIYQLVLHALASIRPGLISLEYEQLRAAIRDVSASQVPQLQEVARVLKHMASIAATDQSSTPVIDFEEEEKKLHITDPFFAFYLRWGELAQ